MGKALSSEEKILLKNEINQDPIFLLRDILGYKDIIDLHSDLFYFTIKDRKECLILIPRGHFKTSVITVGYSIWRILQDRNIRININNKLLSNSKKFLSEIRSHFEENPMILELYGDMRGPVWQQDQIRVAGRSLIKKEPTIQIGALDHEATGAHFDEIINDDLVGLKDMVSEAEREKTLNFYRSMKYLIDRKAQTKIIDIGTRWHLDDLYAYIIKKLKKDQKFIRKAIKNDMTPLFPQIWTMEDLNNMRDDDLIMFSSQMLNEPIPSETQLFKYEELEKNLFEIDHLDLRQYEIVNYTDFAMSKTSRNDFTANITLAYNKTDIFVIDAYIERYTPEMNIARIKEVVDNYNITEIGAEANNFQELYVDELQKALNKDIRKIKHSTDKVLRINAIHPIVKREVHFRKDWEIAYPRLIQQLIRFPEAKHDDGPDALEGGISMIRKSNQLIRWGPTPNSDEIARGRGAKQVRDRLVQRIMSKKEAR